MPFNISRRSPTIHPIRDTALGKTFAITTARFPSRDEAQERQRNDATLDVERLKRADSVRNAIAITEMEGGQPSAFCRELLILYENGEISGAEMRKRMLGKARGRD